MQLINEFRSRLRKSPPLLYAIVNSGPAVAGAEELALELLEEGVDALQLRAKDAAADELADLATSLLPAAIASATPLILNDRVDVAISVGAHGVHVGQADLPPDEARALLGPDAILGLSTHSLEELNAAQYAPVDYLGFGAIFETATREASIVVGLETLTAAAAASTLPLVAIGGFTPERAGPCAASGCAGVAVASALAPATRCRQAVREFRESLRGH